MEFTDVGVAGSPLCSDRLMPQIGPNHQVTMPPLKQSARIASLEYVNRDQWYACGLPVPITYIAAPPFPRNWSSSAADQDKSASLASTSNSRTSTLPAAAAAAAQPKIPIAMASKDANSCASSTKETCQACKKEESSALTIVDAFQGPSEEQKQQAMDDDVPGVSGQSELKSSITSLVQGSSIIMKKKKKRRSCWQTLKRKGTNKKARIEKGRKDKRWSAGSLLSEVGEAASWQGSAGGRGVGESFGILPGSQPDSWSDGEVAAFTLALYLFDKDLCAIKRFLETKKMKDILHFYYGKFYGTPAFCRWAGSKNSRNRKCVHGPRILQGWRQDELLRRLLPHFPDTSKDGIPEAVKSFNERELSVEGLASELKAAVGLEVLVHCVGIGVPKRDLTAVHGDPAKHGGHHAAAASGRVESTTGKACSSLSKEEMLECLTGDLRISKTRAHDLFWEAVWPRLLSHGWHSTTECDILLFLRPGVTEKVKGSSERGVHYFDSVSAVLKAVASDPCLLDGPELTGDTMEGSDNQEDDDEEDGQGWSDDMFETLDMHRLRGPRVAKTTAEAGLKKNEQVAFKASSTPSEELAAQDSSESSSVDIDLNRPLSAVVSSKPPELPKEVEVVTTPTQNVVTHHHRFPIEDLDLNLPPADLDCNSPLLTTEDNGELQLELQTCSNPVEVTRTTSTAAPVEGGSGSIMRAINLNDPLPSPERLMEEADFDSTQPSGLVEQEQVAERIVGVATNWPVSVELVAFDSFSGIPACDSPQSPDKAGASCACGCSDSCRCQSRKRSLNNYQEVEIAAHGGDKGKELVSVPKKRALRFELPFRLDGVGTPNFFFTTHMDAVAARMNSWSKMGIQSTPRASDSRQDWNIRVSASLLPFHDSELQLPKCRVVEIDSETAEIDAEKDGNEGHVQRSLSTFTPLAGKYGNVKRLQCHFSETEAPILSSYSRSKLQRLPRKYALDSRSSKDRLLKSKERCSDWPWSESGGNITNVVETLSCCSNRHGIPATEQQFALEETQQREGGSSEDDGVPGDLERPQGITSGVLGIEKGVTEETEQSKSLMRAWKEPCLTLTSPGDSCDSYEWPRQMPRSRGIRSSGRSHSQNLSVKSISIDNFDVGLKRSSTDLQEFEISKKVKVDASYSLRSREMTEQDLLITLCSMQEEKLQGTTSTEVNPKVKGKRSSRIRRRDFSFKQFIFDGHVEDVEEGLIVQPCTSQGPWRPSCHLPTTEKILRTPKLRRRRSGLPCKGSCVTVATSPIGSGSKGGGTSSKGLVSSQSFGHTVTADEESPAPLNRPVHDVRFSLRRAFSDSSVKTERQIGRKVPARWNQFHVC